MAKNPITGLVAGFKDPVKRPRFLIWTGAVLMSLVVFVIAAIGVTSGYWFCGSFCHSVQQDAVMAYNQGSHSNIACVSCHLPVNADPITFLYHKAHAGILGGYQLATKTYSVPLNPVSHLALNYGHMGEGQCTQCHNMERRNVTPSAGIIIDHKAHSEAGIHCTACHNRVAHPEAGIDLIAKRPDTGEKTAMHADFMTMTACFRCHTVTGNPAAGEEFEAPGNCSACHPANFELKPANHKAADFYPKGHADLAMMEVDHVTGRPAENIVRPYEYGKSEGDEAHAAEGAEATGTVEGDEAHGPDYAPGADDHTLHLAPVQDVEYCLTCHVEQSFCLNCHGMEMPHPEEFKTKTHPETAATMIDKCEFCHQQSTTLFCDSCHHGKQVDWTFDPAMPWQNQHAKTVVEKGVSPCLGACHEKQFCVDCHTNLKPVPTSHAAADWLHGGLTVTQYPDGRAVPTASHALLAQKSIDACDVCHGPGEIAAAFCADCHKVEMPHPAQFKTNHVSGRNTPQVCANCHQQRELCSDCHHKGAVNGTPWQQQHPVTVAADGAQPCFEKCHQDKQFCVDCHVNLKALPTSHKTGDWTRRVAVDQPAKHQVAYKAATDSCDYCHGEGGVKAAFCQSCHQLEMPHPSGYDEGHQKDLQAGTPKTVCTNCHTQQIFCDSCHHPGAVAEQPWRTFHPAVVKKDGAQPCFKCHEPTFCSYCHVRL